jgi:hypothetical protein
MGSAITPAIPILNGSYYSSPYQMLRSGACYLTEMHSGLDLIAGTTINYVVDKSISSISKVNKHTIKHAKRKINENSANDDVNVTEKLKLNIALTTLGAVGILTDAAETISKEVVNISQEVVDETYVESNRDVGQIFKKIDDTVNIASSAYSAYNMRKNMWSFFYPRKESISDKQAESLKKLPSLWR